MPHIQVWIYSTGIYGLTWPDLVFVEMRLNKFPELLKLQWPLAHKLRWKVCVCWGGGGGSGRYRQKAHSGKKSMWGKPLVWMQLCKGIKKLCLLLLCSALLCTLNTTQRVRHSPVEKKWGSCPWYQRQQAPRTAAGFPFFPQWESADLTNNHVASNLGCILCDP